MSPACFCRSSQDAHKLDAAFCWGTLKLQVAVVGKLLVKYQESELSSLFILQVKYTEVIELPQTGRSKTR